MVLSTFICLCLEHKVKMSQAGFTCESLWHPSMPVTLLLLKGPTNPLQTPLHSCWHLAFHSTLCTRVKLQNYFLGGHLPLRLLILSKVQTGANLSTSSILWYHSPGRFRPLLQKHELLYQGKKSACLAANAKLWKTRKKKLLSFTKEGDREKCCPLMLFIVLQYSRLWKGLQILTGEQPKLFTQMGCSTKPACLVLKQTSSFQILIFKQTKPHSKPSEPPGSLCPKLLRTAKPIKINRFMMLTAFSAMGPFTECLQKKKIQKV